MEAEKIYHRLKSIVYPIHAHDDQMVAIAKWIEEEFEDKREQQPKQQPKHQSELNYTNQKWYNTTDGEANFYGIAIQGNWLMRIQQNGELSKAEQEGNMALIEKVGELYEDLKWAVMFIKARYPEQQERKNKIIETLKQIGK